MTNNYEKLLSIHLHPARIELDAPRFTLTVEPAASQRGSGGRSLSAEFPGGK
jgi:hypothetical protein